VAPSSDVARRAWGFCGEPDADGILPYQGRPLEPEELEAIRQQIEQFDNIEAIDPEMRGIVERNWPHLISKLPPQDADGDF